jgi:GTP-binding protein HflX
MAGRLRARLFEAGAVVAENADDEGWNMELDLPLVLAEQLCAGPGADAAALRGQLLAAS